MPRWTYADVPDLTGRTALVTGANSGIGLVEARVLAQHGADVVLAVRRPEAGEEAAERIRRTGAPGRVVVEELDLASLESVRALADRLGERVGGRLDLLLNNAGVMTPPRHRETRDGFELQFGTNHLGHFALTGRLLPLLLAADAPRVTTVSSIAHRRSGRRRRGRQPARGLRPADRLRTLQARQPPLRRRAPAARGRRRHGPHVDRRPPRGHRDQPRREPGRDGGEPDRRHRGPVGGPAALPQPRAGGRGTRVRGDRGRAGVVHGAHRAPVRPSGRLARPSGARWRGTSRWPARSGIAARSSPGCGSTSEGPGPSARGARPPEGSRVPGERS